jgi:ABC-type transporter Mla subunit MlaD
MSDGASARYTRREIIVGLLFVALLAGLAFVSSRYLNTSRFWKKRQQIFVVFENVGTLTKDAPVRYNGFEIGSVKSLRPLHLDEKVLADKFRMLTRGDLNNLPLRDDALKRELLELPPERFDKACREKLLGASMVELCLEVLNDNDPIRYRLDDEVRIESTVFGDSAIEIVSGSGPVNAAPNQYVIGTSGDFFTNLQNSMSEVKKILGGVSEIVGDAERKSFANAQRRYSAHRGLSERIAGINKYAAERSAKTLKRYNDLTDSAKDRLADTRKVLESFQPSAQTATDSMQSALKDIQLRIQQAREETGTAMDNISKDFTVTREAIRIPVRQVREGIDSVKGDMVAAKTDAERAPARLDAAFDAAGSMQSQSTADLNRAAVAAQKAIFNLKITAFVAKENKDLVFSGKDSGEYFAQTSLDIQRKLSAASRRVFTAASDVLDAAHDLESDVAADPVIGRAENAARKLGDLRAPIDEAREALDEAMQAPWISRKRAAWHGDGLPRY